MHAAWNKGTAAVAVLLMLVLLPGTAGHGLKMEVTAYTAGPESTGKTRQDPEYGITASGRRVQPDHTLACPQSLDFGTIVYIPFFGEVYRCEDRGAAIRGARLDVYMQNVEKAVDFGRRKLWVYIIPDSDG
jgi:3D (Asp-Asp-Asp) domain-containing protein